MELDSNQSRRFLNYFTKFKGTHYVIMKNLILATGALLTSIFAFSQKIYTTSSEYSADIKVYVVDSEYSADLKVYKVSSEYSAKDNKGLWYFEDSEYSADKKIYFVNSEYNADLKIYFVDSEYSAGWRESSKKHLLY